MAKDKKKRRKTVSEFFSTMNTNKAEHLPKESGDVVVNPKSKKAKWFLGGTVFALATIGISVPWALSSCEIISKKPFDPSEIMYEITIGNVTHKVTYQEFEDRANSYVSRDNQKIIDLTNSFNASVVKNLYDEEHDAYLKFKAIIDQKNKDLKTGETVGAETYGYDVSKPSDKIKEEQEKNLNDAKKSFQSSLGRNWEEKWLTELKTNPIYGFQDLKDQTGLALVQIEKKAVEYMTTQALKKPALARFEAADIVTDKWTRKDLTWEPSQDIKYRDSKNNEKTVTKNEAKKFIKDFIDVNSNAKSSDKSVDNLNKLAVFETKSYVPDKRKPNQLLKDVLPNFYNSAVISSFDLAIKPGESNLSAFTFDRSVITSLFKITENPVSSLVEANKFAAILQLSKFKGALIEQNTSGQPANSLEKQRAEDEQLLLNLSGATSTPPADGGGGETTPPATTFAEGDEGETPPAADPSKQLGSSKFKIFNDHISGADDTNEVTRWTNVIALGSDDAPFTTSKATAVTAADKLFNAKEWNPFNVFIDLLLTIDKEGDQPTFKPANSPFAQVGNGQDYTKLESFWNEINGAGASQQIVKFVKLIKNSFKYPNKTQSKPFAAATTPDSGLTGVEDTISSSYNTDLQNIIDSFSDADLAFLGKLFTVSFIDADARVNNIPGQGVVDTGNGGTSTTPGDINDYNQASGFWSLYKLSDNTFLHLNSEGMKIFTRDVITTNTVDKIDKMILDDLERTLDPKTSTSLLYEVKSIYEKINNENIINYELLNKASTTTYLDANQQKDNLNVLLFKYKLIQDLLPEVELGPFDNNGNFMNKLTEDQKTLINDSFKIFSDFTSTSVTTLFAEEESKALEKITDILTSSIDKKKYYEFTIVQTSNRLNEVYWQNDPSKPYKPTTQAAAGGTGLEEDKLGITKIQTKFIEKYLKLVKPKIEITTTK